MLTDIREIFREGALGTLFRRPKIQLSVSYRF